MHYCHSLANLTHSQFAVVNPPKFAVVVEAPSKVSVVWVSGGLDEWLEFRTCLLWPLSIMSRD